MIIMDVFDMLELLGIQCEQSTTGNNSISFMPAVS